MRLTFGNRSAEPVSIILLSISVCASVLEFNPPPLYGQQQSGKLDAVRKEVREANPPEDAEDEDHKSRNDDSDDDNDSFLGSLIGELFSKVFFGVRVDHGDGEDQAATYIAVEQAPYDDWGRPMPYPPWRPHDPTAGPPPYSTPDPSGLPPSGLPPPPGYEIPPIRQAYWINGRPGEGPPPSGKLFFAPYPYAQGVEGYMMRDDWVPAPPQPWVARVGIEYGAPFDDIHRVSAALVDTAGRWGLDAQWNSYFERTAFTRDSLHLGDVNLLYRFGQFQLVQWRLGVGFNWLHDQHDTNFGYNVTLGADIQPVAPWILIGEMDVGSLGEATLIHGALTCGVVWRRLEIFIGYDHRQIGDVELEGPMLGTRGWF